MSANTLKGLPVEEASAAVEKIHFPSASWWKASQMLVSRTVIGPGVILSRLTVESTESPKQ